MLRLLGNSCIMCGLAKLGHVGTSVISILGKSKYFTSQVHHPIFGSSNRSQMRQSCFSSSQYRFHGICQCTTLAKEYTIIHCNITTPRATEQRRCYKVVPHDTHRSRLRHRLLHGTALRPRVNQPWPRACHCITAQANKTSSYRFDECGRRADSLVM